ncbi:MAG: single-stranded DNA-binding protein [Magnetococcus sp. WYHC-3]
MNGAEVPSSLRRWHNVLELEGMVQSVPDLRSTPAGTPVLRFELRHEPEVAEDDASLRIAALIEVVLIGPLAERHRSLRPGSALRVCGVLNQQRWLRQGQVRWGRMELVARDVFPRPGMPADGGTPVIDTDTNDKLKEYDHG